MIRERLAAIGEDVSQLDAILITHEHSDHIAGLPVLARATGKPVFLTHLTAPTIEWNGRRPDAIETFQAGSSLEIGELSVQSFTLPHDAVDPVGYTVIAQGVKISIATDLGYMPDSVRVHLRGSHFLVLESNHDVDMLKVGPYPWTVKQRVLSRKGHLSNDTASEYIREELPCEVHTLVLGHLSENNNHPAIAEMTAKQALERCGRSPRLLIAEPRRASEIFLY